MKRSSHLAIWMFPKIGLGTPKMDGENNGNPYFEMDDLGVYTIIFGNTQISKDCCYWFKGKDNPSKASCIKTVMQSCMSNATQPAGSRPTIFQVFVCVAILLI